MIADGVGIVARQPEAVVCRDDLLFGGTDNRYELRDVVSRLLYPDATALALLQQDVLSPWTGNTSSTTSATLTRRARVKTIAVSTPLDGTLGVTARAAKSERVRVQILSPSGVASASTVVAGAASRSTSGTVCGTRTVRVRLKLTGGSGRVVLTTSSP